MSTIRDTIFLIAIAALIAWNWKLQSNLNEIDHADQAFRTKVLFGNTERLDKRLSKVEAELDHVLDSQERHLRAYHGE